MSPSNPFLVWAMGGGLQTALNPYWIVFLKSHFGIRLACAASQGALGFVTMDALRALSNEPVYGPDDKWHPISGRPMHLVYSECDLLLVFPATSRIIAEAAVGSVTCPVTRLIAFTPAARVAFVPSIHQRMDSSAYSESFHKLGMRGCKVFGISDGSSPWKEVQEYIVKFLNPNFVSHPPEVMSAFGSGDINGNV